jgi:hypothetical protein
MSQVRHDMTRHSCMQSWLQLPSRCQEPGPSGSQGRAGRRSSGGVMGADVHHASVRGAASGAASPQQTIFTAGAFRITEQYVQARVK